MIRKSRFIAAALTINLAACLTLAQTTKVEQMLVRGVYWPWERTQYNADAAGKELWQFADETMAYLKTNMHCNVIWFVNGPRDPLRALDLAAKHGLLAFCGVMPHEFNYGFSEASKIQKKVREEVERFKDNPALAAYVLKDEPRVADTEFMEACRAAFAELDPNRPSIVVTMTHYTESYALRSRFPIVCTDIYHFGGPRSPYIPSPSATSQRTYRGCVEALNDMAAKARKTAWAMPQAYAEFWGPSWHDSQGNEILEPGSYWHWRMPNVAETHWQTWEAIRAGSRGVIYFVLFTSPNPWNPQTDPMPEKMAQRLAKNKEGKIPVTTKRIETGDPSSLLYPGGDATRQSQALALDFALLEKLEPMITQMRPSRIPVVFADKPAAVATFEIPGQNGARYAIVVNDNLKEESELPLLFLPHINAAVNMLDDNPLALEEETIGTEGLLRGSIKLEPGMGTLLKLECDPAALMPLLAEDFSTRNVAFKLENVVRRPKWRGYGMGSYWAVSRDETNPDSEGMVTWAPKKIVSRALGEAAKNKTRLYLFAEGRFPRPETFVVNFKDKDGGGGWNKTSEYYRPVAIPGDTASIELALRSKDASLARVRIWRVDSPDKSTRKNSR